MPYRTEAGTCRQPIPPKLHSAGRGDDHTVTHLDDVQAKVDRLKALQAQNAAELDALLPSILDQAFQAKL